MPWQFSKAFNRLSSSDSNSSNLALTYSVVSSSRFVDTVILKDSISFSTGTTASVPYTRNKGLESAYWQSFRSSICPQGWRQDLTKIFEKANLHSTIVMPCFFPYLRWGFLLLPLLPSMIPVTPSRAYYSSFWHWSEPGVIRRISKCWFASSSKWGWILN